MLILTRRKNESIVINNDITLTVVEIRGDKVRLGVVCPKDVAAHRQEVFDAIHGVARPRSWSPEERAFLRAIEDRPDDEATRLVFADWLEERGDPLSELLRLQCGVARLPVGDRRRRSLMRREHALWAKHEADGWAALPLVLRRGPAAATGADTRRQPAGK
jgi:carbon storage regulator